MRLRRRQFLKACAALACGGAGASLARGEPAADAAAWPRHLTLQNLHTDEVLDIDYASGEFYIPDAVARIEHLLRDFRTGEQHPIDPRLLDCLHEVAAALGTAPVFGVISGYRSPQTNEQLRSQSDGVALHSLHMDGRAIDVRLAGIDCTAVAACAWNLGRGGVGYYRRSDFVHLDTGAVRSWRG